MKKFILLIIILPILANAQERKVSIGGKAGLNLSKMTSVDTDELRIGVAAGFAGVFKLNEMVFINSELLFENKGSTRTIVLADPVTGSPGQVIKGVDRYTYVAIPVVARISILKNSVSPFISLGGYGSYLIDHSVIYIPKDNKQEKTKINNSGGKTLDAGICAGIGMSLKFDNRTRALIEARYNHGEAHVYPDVRHRYLTFSITGFL